LEHRLSIEQATACQILAVEPRQVEDMKHEAALGARTHVALQLFEVRESGVVEVDDLAIEPRARDVQLANRLHKLGQSLTPFDAAAGVQANVVALLPSEESPTIVLDLMQPIVAARRLLDERAELRLEDGRERL
jgi:hypothetical protein